MDLTTRKVVFSTEVVAIRETIAIALINTGSAVATNLRLGVLDRQTELAYTDDFVSGTGQFDGTLDLNTTALIDFFARFNDARKKRRFDLGLWDTSRNKLMINDKINIMNNPYFEGMPLPTEL